MARRDLPRTDAEVIELDLSNNPGPAPYLESAPSSGRSRWWAWMLLAPLVAGGLALIPDGESDPALASTPDTLGEPVLATTSTTLSAASIAVMSDENFRLTPTVGLDGFIQVAGPTEFNGQWWIAGNYSHPSSEAVILSSNNGVTWDPTAVIDATEGDWVRVDDLESFGGVFIAVGSVGRAVAPGYAPATAGSLVIWKSADGHNWTTLPVASEEGVAYLDLRLVAGSEEVLISGYRSDAFETQALSLIPEEFLPGLERGDFDLWHDNSTLRIVAPPGLLLFSTPARQQQLESGFSDIRFRSENLMVWEEPDEPYAGWVSPIAFEDGFVSGTQEGGALHSPDGVSWQLTDQFPLLSFQNWGDRLTGLDYRGRLPQRMVVLDGEGESFIELPTEITGNGQFGIQMAAGNAGLALVGGVSGFAYVGPMAQVDGYLLIIESQGLTIQGPSGETNQADFDRNGLIEGSFVPETQSVRFSSTDGNETFEFTVLDLLNLRSRSDAGTFEIFRSEDGLVWAQAQTAVRADQVDIFDSADRTFLVALRNYGANYRQLPMIFYAAGYPG